LACPSLGRKKGREGGVEAATQGVAGHGTKPNTSVAAVVGASDGSSEGSGTKELVKQGGGPRELTAKSYNKVVVPAKRQMR